MGATREVTTHGNFTRLTDASIDLLCDYIQILDADPSITEDEVLERWALQEALNGLVDQRAAVA